MYVLNMTSQTWKDETVSNHPVWSHHLVVALPKGNNFTHKDAAFMFIGGGSQRSSPPNPETDDDLFLFATCEYARDVGVATGYLKQIPNQPFTFTEDPAQRARTEDDLIAFTWRKFIENTSDPEILLRMPMTKAGVRAMDTINAVAREKVPDSNVTKFFVSGGSKRGWVAWMLAATDRRVAAAAPIVLTMLHMQPNLNHHFQAYGGWSFAFNDYYNENITQYVNDPRLQLLANVVDPYEYRERLTMPKVVVCAAGDEFFKPDESWFFFEGLPYPKYMMLMENTHHGVSLSQLRVYEALAAFFKAVLTGYRMPQLTWNIYQTTDIDGNVIGVTRLFTDTEPVEISAYIAATDERYPDMRDFRWATAEEQPRLILWENSTLIERVGGQLIWDAEVPELPGVWTGLIVNAMFEGPPPIRDLWFDFTTEINIVPNTMPYDPCSTPAECYGELK